MLSLWRLFVFCPRSTAAPDDMPSASTKALPALGDDVLIDCGEETIHVPARLTVEPPSTRAGSF
jgi:hypothetical protein